MHHIDYNHLHRDRLHQFHKNCLRYGRLQHFYNKHQRYDRTTTCMTEECNSITKTNRVTADCGISTTITCVTTECDIPTTTTRVTTDCNISTTSTCVTAKCHIFTRSHVHDRYFYTKAGLVQGNVLIFSTCDASASKRPAGTHPRVGGFRGWVLAAWRGWVLAFGFFWVWRWRRCGGVCKKKKSMFDHFFTRFLRKNLYWVKAILDKILAGERTFFVDIFIQAHFIRPSETVSRHVHLLPTGYHSGHGIH